MNMPPGVDLFEAEHNQTIRWEHLLRQTSDWQGTLWDKPDRAIVSEKWIGMARTPGPANATYGFANWYLNTERKPLPAAPASAVRFVGNGNNIIYIDWENDLVIVTRWATGVNDLVGKTIASLTTSPTSASR